MWNYWERKTVGARCLGLDSRSAAGALPGLRCYCAGRSVPGRADKERLRAGEAGHSRDIVTSFLFWEIITSPAALPALLGYGYENQPHRLTSKSTTKLSLTHNYMVLCLLQFLIFENSNCATAMWEFGRFDDKSEANDKNIKRISVEQTLTLKISKHH